MSINYKKVTGLDELKQAVDGFWANIDRASASSSQMFKPARHLYLELYLGSMHAYISVHDGANNTATALYSEVNEHIAPKGVQQIVESAGQRKITFIDANKVTDALVHRTQFSVAEPLKGTEEERAARAREFVEGVTKPIQEIVNKL